MGVKGVFLASILYKQRGFEMKCLEQLDSNYMKIRWYSCQIKQYKSLDSVAFTSVKTNENSLLH